MEAVNGGNKQVSFQTNVQCKNCKGTGNSPKSKITSCNNCGGTGRVNCFFFANNYKFSFF